MLYDPLRHHGVRDFEEARDVRPRPMNDVEVTEEQTAAADAEGEAAAIETENKAN